MSPGRVVSLVPSLTELAVLLGAGDKLVGVTSYCNHAGAAQVGGSKFFEPETVLELHPDLVLANTEENHPERLAALREAGAPMLETFPRTVAAVRPMIAEVAEALAADASEILADLEAAEHEAAAGRPGTPVAALVLVWRKPWMGVGPDTYVDDLLRVCGFANVLAGGEGRYPTLDPAMVLGPEVVLLPDEPYAFGPDDLPAVAELLGDVPHRFVDGEVLTWHGPRTAQALRVFTRLAVELRAG